MAAGPGIECPPARRSITSCARDCYPKGRDFGSGSVASKARSAVAGRARLTGLYIYPQISDLHGLTSTRGRVGWNRLGCCAEILLTVSPAFAGFDTKASASSRV